MRSQTTPLLISSLAGLAAATCCNNACLRAIVAPSLSSAGVAECSSFLSATATTSTFTSTITVIATGYVTDVDSDFFTQTETTTVSTEEDVFTDTETSIFATQTDSFTALETTTVSVETELSTVTVTAGQGSPPTATEIVHRRAPTASTSTSIELPSYPSACPSLEAYASACSCVLGIGANATVPATTITVTETETLISTIVDTASVTGTVFVNATATSSSTKTDIISATVTVSATVTDVSSITATTLLTVTETATPTPSSTISTFYAMATNYGDTPLYMYAYLESIVSTQGNIDWEAYSASNEEKYAWSFDDNGYLYLAGTIAPFDYVFYAYYDPEATGSQWPAIAKQSTVEAYVSAGSGGYITGSFDAETGELTLNAGGRENMLYCAVELWMSTGDGSDINRGGCTEMYPTVVAA